MINMIIEAEEYHIKKYVTFAVSACNLKSD
jgi:hypothetical protein